AARHRLPLICGFREMTEAGCLFSYSASLKDMWYRSATFVDKILKGAKPSDNDIRVLAARNLKNSDRQTSSKNCSLNRDVECPSVGTIFAHGFSERSAHGGSLTIAAKEGP